MARYTKQEQEEARDKLRELLDVGDTVHLIVTHVARSGMTRWIECYVIRDDIPRRVSYDVAAATGQSYDTRGNRGVEMGGCGMDMGFALVYSLGRALWPEGFPCTGIRTYAQREETGRPYCPANDHANDPRGEYEVHRDAGYALVHRYLG